MGKQNKRKARRRDAWLDDPLAVANEGVRAAERQLLEARQRAATAAASRNGHKPPAAPEEQAEEFFNRPGDFYIAQFEIPQTTTGGPIRAQCVVKADEAQRDYLVEVMRQIRGAFGENARISLSRARQQQQRVVARGTDGGIGAAHRAAAEAVRRRNEQLLANNRVTPPEPSASLWDLENAAADMLAPAVGPPAEVTAEVCKAHRDPDCKRCDDTVDDLWVHPRDLTREELQEQLPGMTRAEVAEELGVDPADIGGEFKHTDDIEIEQLAAELGLSPLDLQPIEMRGGGRVYAVKPRQLPPPPGRHARPEQESGDDSERGL